jgi:hypothetical protein
MPAGVLVCLVAILLTGVEARAHRLDEYLQTARVDLEPARVVVDLNLTPGAELAPVILALIDRDGDGAISPGEETAYIETVMADLEIALDGEPLDPRPLSSTFPPLSAFDLGEGTIRLQVAAPHSRAAGAHRLSFRNSHLGALSVYLANALVPVSPAVSVAGQARNRSQSELDIDYSVRTSGRGRTSGAIAFSLAATGSILWLTRRRRCCA